MIGPQLNSALRVHLDGLGSPYTSAVIVPLHGQETTSAPYIVWAEFPAIDDPSAYWVEVSNILYAIFDTDLSRLKDIQRVMKKYFNDFDSVGSVKADHTVSTPYQRLLSTLPVSGGMFIPLEREGFYSMNLTVEVKYILE